jgi:hypothetical protein
MLNSIRIIKNDGLFGKPQYRHSLKNEEKISRVNLLYINTVKNRNLTTNARLQTRSAEILNCKA